MESSVVIASKHYIIFHGCCYRVKPFLNYFSGVGEFDGGVRTIRYNSSSKVSESKLLFIHDVCTALWIVKKVVEEPVNWVLL